MKHLFPDPAPGDAEIVELTNELVDRIGSTWGSGPKGVSWQKKVPTGGLTQGTRVPSDFPRLWGIQLIIAKHMRGRLDPEDWKPLIASSLIYDSDTMRRRRNSRMMRRVGPPITLIGLLIEIPAALLWGYRGAGIACLALIGGLGFVGSLLSLPLSRLGRLEADTKAAEIVSRESLRQTLFKIDRMGLLDIEKLKHGDRWHGLPSITRRIENLQSDQFSAKAD